MKANWQKKFHFSGHFFLTILEAGASAVEPVGLQLSYKKKRLPVVYKYFKVKLVVFYVLNLPI